MTALAVVSILATIGSTAYAYSQQQAASKQAQAMADYNYALQKQQAEVQSALMAQQANQNAQLSEYQASIQQRNAEVLRLQADAVSKQYGIASEAERKAGVTNVQRDREESRRFLALQRAKIGESGTTGAGTPLDALADAAGTLELRAQEVWHGAEIEARKLADVGNARSYELREAARNEGFKSGMSLFEAANQRWEGQAAGVQKRLAIYGAEAERMEGYNTARGYKLASYGTLFSGVASASSAGYSLYSSGAFSGGYGAKGGTLNGGTGYSIGKSPYGYA